MLTSRSGGAAAWVSAGLAIANLLVVFGGLGPEVAADPAKVAALVTTRPAPLLWLEAFKLLSAAAAVVVVLVLQARLAAGATGLMKTATRAATGAGLLAALLLASAGVAGLASLLYAMTAQPGSGADGAAAYQAVNAFVNGLGLGALAVNGLWYLGAAWAALRQQGLPRGLAVLGLVLGALSLIAWAAPPAALLVLVLSLAWSVWLGLTLWHQPVIAQGTFA